MSIFTTNNNLGENIYLYILYRHSPIFKTFRCFKTTVNQLSGYEMLEQNLTTTSTTRPSPSTGKKKVLYLLRFHRGPRDALLTSVHIGGDVDSVAALCLAVVAGMEGLQFGQPRGLPWKLLEEMISVFSAKINLGLAILLVTFLGW